MVPAEVESYAQRPLRIARKSKTPTQERSSVELLIPLPVSLSLQFGHTLCGGPMKNRALTSVLLVALLLSGLLPTVAHAGKTWTCGFYTAGGPATIVGTPRSDVLRGTPEGDVIVGRGGNDIIRGGGGPDHVCAGRGADVVRGGYDEDFLRGGRGNDRLFGDQDDWDGLNGGPGDDYIDGGDVGRNEVNYQTAARGVNINMKTGVARGDGRDTLVNIGSVVASPFDDTIFLGPGSPLLFELVAGDGNDILTLGRGLSYPDGGYGDDTYNILEGAAWDEMDDRGGHDIYNICNDAFSKDWTPSEDLDNDYEVHFC
jgi:Ca2+-binding RTX toxin-like protein